MLQLVGPILLGIAVLHVGAALFLFGDGLAAIGTAGLGTGATWTPDMKAAFWFLQFAWPVGLLGLVCIGAFQSLRDIPFKRVMGGVMGAASLVSAVLVPVSGFWLVLIPAALLVLGKAQR